MAVLAHLSLAHWMTFSTTIPLSIIHHFHRSFSHAALPVNAKFYAEPPWVGGAQVCSNGLGHMTKLATTLIYEPRREKRDLCICENKDIDQFRGNRETDLRLCFRYLDSTIPLLS